MKNPMPVPRSGSVGIVLLLLVFCLAYVLGLMSSAIFQNIYIHNTLSPLQLSVFWSQSSSPSSPPPPPEAVPCILPPSPPSQTTVPRTMSMTPSGGRRMEFTDFLAPSSGLMHNMTDEELFWRASMAPSMKSMPKHVIVHKIAFLFLVRGELPLTTGKSDIAVCQMSTAKRPRNTAKALPCVNTRQNLHGIVPYGKEHFAVLFQHAHGKDLCRVFFVLHGSEK
jgi:hypothetical protein